MRPNQRKSVRFVLWLLPVIVGLSAGTIGCAAKEEDSEAALKKQGLTIAPKEEILRQRKEEAEKAKAAGGKSGDAAANGG